jgi:hypothetical protein
MSNNNLKKVEFIQNQLNEYFPQMSPSKYNTYSNGENKYNEYNSVTTVRLTGTIKNQH